MIIRATHVESCRFTLESGGHVVTTDQAVEYGGEGRGPMPSELLLWSVAACFGHAMLYVASRMRKEINGLVLEVSGVKDRKHFRFAGIDIRIQCSQPVENMDRIVQLAKEYCFVTNSLAVPVSCEVVDATTPAP